MERLSVKLAKPERGSRERRNLSLLLRAARTRPLSREGAEALRRGYRAGLIQPATVARLAKRTSTARRTGFSRFNPRQMSLPAMRRFERASGEIAALAGRRYRPLSREGRSLQAARSRRRMAFEREARSRVVVMHPFYGPVVMRRRDLLAMKRRVGQMRRRPTTPSGVGGPFG